MKEKQITDCNDLKFTIHRTKDPKCRMKTESKDLKKRIKMVYSQQNVVDINLQLLLTISVPFFFLIFSLLHKTSKCGDPFFSPSLS